MVAQMNFTSNYVNEFIFCGPKKGGCNVPLPLNILIAGLIHIIHIVHIVHIIHVVHIVHVIHVIHITHVGVRNGMIIVLCLMIVRHHASCCW